MHTSVGDCNFPWLMANVLNKETKEPLGGMQRARMITHQGRRLVGTSRSPSCGLRVAKAWLGTDFISIGRVTDLLSSMPASVLPCHNQRINWTPRSACTCTNTEFPVSFVCFRVPRWCMRGRARFLGTWIVWLFSYILVTWTINTCVVALTLL